MLGYSQLLLLRDGWGHGAQFVQGAEDLRRHRDPAPGARGRDERGIHQRKTTPLAGETRHHFRPAPGLLERPLQEVRGAEPLLVLLGEEQIRQALIQVLLQTLTVRGSPALWAGGNRTLAGGL